jgi:hypothetical protein
MAARSLINACACLLLLLMTLEFGATIARGQSTGFRVIGPGVVVVGDNVYRLDNANFPFGWHQLPYGNFTLPPVPPSSLIDWEAGQVAITDQGEGWAKVNGEWADLGPAPGITVTHSVTWGQLKTKYRP